MPGRSFGPISDTALFVGTSVYLFGPTFLSGYCLHRVKCSQRTGIDRHIYYIYSYLVFLIPNIPLFYFATFEAGELVIATCYLAGVTIFLFGMLTLSPPGKRRYMYISGVLGIILFYLLASIVA